MAKSYRIERLNGLIKELISELVISQIKDPRVGFVTITAVRVSADLSSAKVHFSVMGDEEARKESKMGLISARNFLRKTIAQELRLRLVPELKFVYDDSLDRAMRIEEALREVRASEDPPKPVSEPDEE